ncbi:MAG: recombination protein NinG [Candidatus Peribacteraceae bacterium]|nr:recombination protein NinG [Candidatus Peribacteraceae bacterium]
MRNERQRAIKTADDWFSRWVRIGNKKTILNGDDVYCQCYTTKSYYHILEIQCGHFITRGHFSTRYDENNARPQSVFANRYKSGMPLEFEQNLIKELGANTIDILKLRGQLIIKQTIPDLRDIAKKYRIKVREKEKELGTKIW